MQKALSLGNNAAADTILRKLQSTMRNNVNANFGARLKLLEQLDEASGYFLAPRIAGQSLSSITPRGLQAVSATGTGVAGVYTNPATLAALPMFSPRLMGETARGVGRVSGAIDRGGGSVGAGINSVVNPVLDGLSPFQRQLMSSAAGTVPTAGQIQLPANLARINTAAQNEAESGTMSMEEFNRLKMMLNPEQQVIAPAP